MAIKNLKINYKTQK